MTLRHERARERAWLSVCAAIVMVVALVLSGPTAVAQSSAASLDGTVLDTSGALVPGSTITLRNQASGDERTATSNAEGFFSFAAVPPGAYTVRVSRQGFSTWEARGILLSSGDHRSVSNIMLKVGTKDETVVVEAAATQITPTDSGDKAFTIDQNIMQNVAIVGQNAAEFIKIMPGMAMTTGALNQSSYAAADERTGNGPVGSFSSNGQRSGSLDITSDGAHIVDPGCNCGQTMNTNADMTSELTVQTSNFGADSAKGPTVINAVGKSGGQQYHGELYTYNRYYSANANDWLNNHQGLNSATGKQLAPRPQTKYFYPGAQIGGPVVLPKLNFNKNHDKLFFFFAFELYRQNVDNGIYTSDVPTDSMRAGDFTQPDSDWYYAHGANGGAGLAGGSVQGVPTNGGPTGNAYTCTRMEVVAGQNSGNPICTASMVVPGAIDPNGQAMMNVFPHANANPATNFGYNYVSAQTRFSNMNQYRGRIDYSISNSTKLFVQYNHQNDNAEESLDTLWTGNAQTWDSPTTPYPSPLIEKSDSETVTANMTKVFTPTLTNELIFNWVYINLPNQFQDPAKVQRGSLGINYTMLFDHGDNSKLIYPQMDGWGDGIPNQLNSGFELAGGVYAKKTLPSVADNITKVWKTHTAKFGFYWERTWNSQPGNGAVNGTTLFDSWQTNGTGNAYANMLIGQTDGYSEQNFNVVPAFRFISSQFYGTDSWKASRKLTLDYGVRFSHLGPWVDTTGYGFAAWYPSLYASGAGGTVAGATFPGIEWNKVHSSTPLSGSASRLFFYSPRVGFAYDILGTGNTILRGGYGIYNFHDEQNVQNGAYGIVRGSFGSPTISASSNASCTSAQLGTSNCKWSGKLAELQPLSAYGAGLSIPGGVTALDPTDSDAPQTQEWSLTVAQRAPWKSLVEVAYVGNKSDYLSNYNNNFFQINDLTPGALFTKYGWLPDCYPTGSPANDGGKCGASGADTGFSSSAVQAARPYSYGSLKIINHKMYSNYHALQATWNKQQGHFTYLLNYTFSKALGIRGENGSATGDPTSLKNNYGTLPNNRPHIFNAAYVFQVPGLNPGANAILKGAANGWQISGITQYQTGADLQAAVNANFGYTAFIPAGTTFMGKTITTAIQASNQNILGTSDVNLQPVLTCNPGKGLKSHQYINGSCFSPFATPGQQGSYIFPSLIGPGFFNSDLSVFKNFAFGSSENKKLTFRFSGYNFLNHPIRSFNGSSDPGLSLAFDKDGNLLQHGGQTFGYANFKTGHRIMQGEAKFSF
jgi:hypothetical protein